MESKVLDALLGKFDSLGSHYFLVKIYYEDTDAGGIVYYANCLKFFERGRTNYFSLLFSNKDKLYNEKIKFVVRSCDIRYIKPAFLNDNLIVKTTLVRLRNQLIDFEQGLYRNEDIIVKAKIRIVFVDESGNSCNLSKEINSILENLLRIETNI
ncbi:YbgC/FadM family acyl-CoA thioesterase [Alphaproteobacteria bacterium]|nr:YbgC/FadM family acyl-CoA thioesterase [Alphaproteobacteria bacterium]